MVAAQRPLQPLELRLALATLWDGSARFACALPLWCRSAHDFGHAVLTNVTVVIIMPPSARAQGCSGARSHWPETVQEAMRGYVMRYQDSQLYVRTMAATILKLAVFGLTDYELVFYSDLDVDMHSRWSPKSNTWQHALYSFVHAPVYIAASPDHSSPINTAVMLIKPRQWLLERALRVLRRQLAFDTQTGFNHVGRPRDLVINVTQLALGGFGRRRSAIDAARKRLNDTMAYVRNDWSFVCGSTDQGLFWYLFFVLASHGTWTAQGMVDHYWGPLKPWRPVAESRPSTASRYLWRLTKADEEAAWHGHKSAGNKCMRDLLSLQQRLRQKNAWTNSSSGNGFALSRIDRRPWLPAPSIRSCA